MVIRLKGNFEGRKPSGDSDVYWPGIRFPPNGNGDSAGGCVRYPSNVRGGKENPGKNI